jgi:hypothetical protein
MFVVLTFFACPSPSSLGAAFIAPSGFMGQPLKRKVVPHTGLPLVIGAASATPISFYMLSSSPQVTRGREEWCVWKGERQGKLMRDAPKTNPTRVTTIKKYSRVCGATSGAGPDRWLHVLSRAPWLPCRCQRDVPSVGCAQTYSVSPFSPRNPVAPPLISLPPETISSQVAEGNLFPSKPRSAVAVTACRVVDSGNSRWVWVCVLVSGMNGIKRESAEPARLCTCVIACNNETISRTRQIR